jgi:CheY-like chemotaxis protein
MNITESEKAYDFLTKALGVFGRAKDLTQQLLTFSKGGDPIKQTMGIAPVLKDCVHFMLSGSNISPVFTIPDTLWLCDIDKNQIGQVIDNIVINARQAMPTGGPLFIFAENSSPDSQIPATLRPGNYIKITIRDSGIGIAKEHLLRIFDPFFTTKQQGSGLGLATAYSIVKKHEGYIAVESELGRGTAFHIFLPAVVLSHVAAEDTKEERLVKGSGRILVLDDEEYIRLVITTILTSFGYAIVAASDDEEAIEAFTKAKNESAPFDLVILDLTVPGGLGGKDVLAKLLKFDPAIKAIASSGYSNDPVISAPGKFGFAGSLIKPFLHRALVQVVQETLGKK